MTLEEAQSLYNLRDEVTEVAINLQEIGQEVTVVPALAAELPEYEIDTWDSLRPEIRETLSTKLAFTSAIGFIVIFVASIGILNIQLMAVFERTREMGVLAALGMKSRGIMALFLLEGTLIGALGAIIGVAAGLGLLAWIGRTGIDFSFASGMGEMTALMGDRLYPSVSLADAVSRGITVTIIVMLASFWPAWQASRKEPAESLHHV
jgi:ABC-type lipoprotein release transport system permease subunit